MNPQSQQPKKKKVKPTPKIKKAFKAIMANENADKPRPLKHILKEVGYSDTVSTRPSQVINSDGFQYLLEKAGITDDLLTVKLKEGLDADKPMGRDGTLHPDYMARHKYLESALKLKGIQEVAGANQGLIVNQQINTTNLDPNSTDAQKLVNNTLEILMNQTRAE